MSCLLCSTPIINSISFLNVLFSNYQRKRVCKPCLDKFQEIDRTAKDICSRCMKESREEICEDCSYWLKDNLSMRHESIYKYDQLMRKFFVAYKLQGDYRLKSVFAARLRERLIKYEDYTIVPVPVSRKTLEERGFCQVTSMLEAADIPYLNLFNKSESGSQKFKNRQERLSSQNPFSLIEGISIPNKILIFDDIYTSGRTIAHLLNLLRDVKGLEIRSLSLAR